MNVSNTFVLKTLGVPIINSFSHLSEQLSLSEQFLYVLAYESRYHYTMAKIPKKNGKERVLYMPSLALKVVQKWILTEILEKIRVSEQAMAFVPKKNGLKENAKSHSSKLFLLQMDITNFFGSIREKQVYELFRNIGYNNKVADVLSRLCTYEDVLPQGAVTSPYIANLVCVHLDSRISGLCSRRDVVYTRYADDMAFSSNNRTVLNGMETFVQYIVTNEGFCINEHKTRYSSNNSKKTITGITINNKEIHVDKRYKRNLRAEIYSSINTMNYSFNEEIRGKISYINSIENGYKLRIIDYISKLTLKPEWTCDREKVSRFNQNKLFKEIPDMYYVGLN